MQHQDFRMKIDSTVFGVRATALIVKDNRLLVVEDEDSFYTIGGAIQVDEATEDAKPLPCRWLALDDLHTVNLKPAFLKAALPEWDGQLRHIHLKE